MSEKKKVMNFLYQKDGKVGVIMDDFETVRELKPGFYTVEERGGLFGSSFELVVDNNVKLPKNSFKSVENYIPLDDIMNYFSETSRDIHEQLNLKLKMGILLSGKQGTGKTTICYALGQYLIENNNAVVFTVDSSKSLRFITGWINKVNAELEKKLFPIIIFDECEYYMEHDESSMKTILDSSSSVDNCLMLFTTNYLDKVPDAIKDRPSRIKYSIKVEGMKEESEIFSTLQSINSGLKEDYQIETQILRDMVPGLVGKTLDEIKHSFTDKAYSYLMKSKVYSEKLEAQTA